MVGDVPDNWVTQLRKGLLELCLLNALRDGPRYGYDIVRSLAGIDGLMIAEGTVYPILGRLKREGLVRTSIRESDAGPPRKYYQLTALGRSVLRALNAYWRRLRDGVDGLVQGGESTQTRASRRSSDP